MDMAIVNELSLAPVKSEATMPFYWGAALTLHERAALAPKVPWSGSNIKRATVRFEYWSEQFGIPAVELLECWSAETGLPETDLKKLVGATPEQLQTITGRPPSWVVRFNAIFGLMKEKDRGNLSAFVAPGEDADLAAITWPWLFYATDWIRSLIAQNRPAAKNFFDPDYAISLFLPRLVRRLTWCIQRTFLLELNVARVRGQLSGDTPEDRYHNFCRRIVNSDVAYSIFLEYPVLVRLLSQETEHWVVYISELLQRLHSDWPLIQCDLFDQRATGKLRSANADAGDTHNGGRSVTILEFDSGVRLVYKPRSTAGEKVFSGALEWLNRKTPELPLKTYRVLDRGCYGWCEYVEPAPCKSQAELKRFYHRQGKLLALGFALRMSDLYFENILASGEYPVVADAESIMEMIHSEDLRNPRWFALEQSLLAVGLLPWSMSGPGNTVLDISGLAGGGNQMMSPFPVPVSDGNGRDDARVVHRQVPVPSAHNQPLRGDNYTEFQNHLSDLTDGFTETYKVLSRGGTSFMQTLCARLDYTSCFRLVPRPSRTYARLLSASTHPNLLRDALDRDVLFSRLWKRTGWRRMLIKSERSDLWDGAIPIFTRRPDQTDLCSCHSDTIPVGLPQGLQGTMDRLRHMTESDLHRHVWTIRSAFEIFRKQKIISASVWIPQGCSDKYDFEARCLGLAGQIGKRLLCLAARQKGAVNWLDAKPIGGGFRQGPTGRMELAGMGADFYSGISGMTLFFRYLANCSQDPQFLELAHEISHYLVQVAENFSLQEPDLGMMTGIAGILYTLTHLTGLHDDRELVHACNKCVAALSPVSGVESKLGFDINSGSAGIICALLAHYSTFSDLRALRVAIKHAEHIINNAETMSSGVAWRETNTLPLAGFAHGAAGIAYALTQLFRVTGTARFKDVALEAVRFERSLFDNDIHNWVDRRDWVRSSNLKPVGCVSWCTGAAGIGLSRLGMDDLFGDGSTLDELRTAFAITLKGALQSQDDCICHGNFGELEFLSAAAPKVAHRDESAGLSMLAKNLVSRIEHDGFRFEGGIEMLNLMTGLAGCGYALLRIARPKAVPSVMLLKPPMVRQETISAY
jgi:type 2 lantibiotic biosynthesis protein LanM